MAITAVQQTEIARILGFPNFSPMSSLQPGYPYFSSQLALWQPYAMLVNRLAQAAPYDEVQYLGAESPLFGQFITASSARLVISTPSTVAPGVLVQLNVAGTSVTYTTASGDTPYTIAAALASEIHQEPNLTGAFMANALPIPPSLYVYNIAAPGTDGNGVSLVAITSDSSVLLTFNEVAAQYAFGTTTGGTVPPGPQFTPLGSTQTVFGYVPIVHTLEGDFLNSRTNLDTLKADVWEPRQDELIVRFALLRRYRQELADRLSVPLDPDIVGNAGRISQRVV